MNIDTQIKKIKDAEAAAEKAENAAREARINAEQRRNELRESLKEERENLNRAINELDGNEVEESEPVIVETPVVEKKKSNGITSFVAGVALTAFLMTGGYFLVKEARKGKVEPIVPEPAVTPTVFETEDGKTISYGYDYEKNVATVTTETTSNIGETTVTIVETENYDELTTEKFEDLCSHVIRYFEEKGISVKKSDVVKFVAAFNIDKLKQDNQDLVRSLMGTQTIEEFFADAEKVSDTLINYEAQTVFAEANPEWSAYVNSWFKGAYCPNTDLLVSVANCSFDTEQQALIKSFEARRNEILKVSDVKTRSDMTKALLLDIMNAKSEYRLFDDASLYFVLRHCIVPLDSMYNWDFLNNKSTLTEDAHKVMVEFIAPVGSTEEEIAKSIMSGAKRNMMDSFKLCMEDAKTLTK